MAVIIGYDMCHYAKLKTDDITSGTATYDTPIRVKGAITANINPNTSDETLFADNGPNESASALGKIELELGAVDFPPSCQADMLGHTVKNGAIIRKGSDVPPWIAVGGRCLKSNGKHRYFWLLKGKMTEPEQHKETKKDKVEFQTPTVKGSFVMRDCDGVWMLEYDEDCENFRQDIVDGWFKSIPTVESILADK